ncbi:TetR/AcrR family transcriptional regulator [Novosphingobium olei]|uniref:TetR/AcrR family transcriptional regulator n=1 Tax=Novosphingobium olei TaxID=2728851 RepID=A0A7Y0G9I3_9SPHN|nr:TetR/AcrR family transcriptional regulator [Novosphingobium olei]NML92677.1 TetR/AcrR family transcriptional regulator [Novosphingobium olei]BEV01465.1 TetR/AcrR family transcriptional regulator [Novosphingobium olei]
MASQLAAPEPNATRPRKLTKRGADTRARILEATVRVIVSSGFAAMTIERVMAESGISRGSVLHQFPNRLALAIATAERTLQVVIALAADAAAAKPDPFERLASHAEVMWQAHSSPEGLALNEIVTAAGWDRELAEGIRPIIEEVEADIRVQFVEMAREAGLPDPDAFVARGWWLVASVRGLVIEHRLLQPRPMIDAALEEMKASHRRYCEAQRDKLVMLD